MQDIAIDIPDNLETVIREEACIYEVPTPIRNVRKKAYTPQVVSIGLIHKDNRNESMELQKKRYLKEFYKRLVAPDCFRGQIERIISEQKQNIINCYEKDPNIQQDDFVKMILLDAVFIMELFLRSCDPQMYGNDFIIGRPWLRIAVKHDLLLLENQLPFNILNQLYNHSSSQFVDNSNPSFLELTFEYFSACGPRGRDTENLQEVNVLHFTDVVRHFWSRGHPASPQTQNQNQNQNHPGNQNQVLYQNQNQNQNQSLHQYLLQNQNQNQNDPGIQNQVHPENQILPSAINLHNHAGVEFESKSKWLHKVTFEEKKYLLWKVGKLIIPYIIIDDSTEGVIRNVMALEQCYYPTEAYVCSYIILLDNLINTVEDVNLLVEAKIIINYLGDNALVAKMINELCYQIGDDTNCYNRQFQQLNDFYRSIGNRRWASLKRVYFKDTWTSTATIVGALVIVLQIAQTFSSI